MQKSMKKALVVIGGLLLSACGGSGGGSVGSPPPPPPPPPTAPSIDVQRVFPNLSFSAPVSMVQAPGDASRWFVVEQSGVVRVFDNNQATNSSSVFVDIEGRVLSGGERGLLGIAFHPQYPGTPHVFLSFTAGPPLTSVVSRFLLDGTGTVLDPASEQVLFTIAQPFGNHNGGDLAFGPDGFLYAGFGDGGSANDPNNNAQTTTNLLGSIVRIDVDGLSPYEVPPDNPFANPDFCTNAPNTVNPCPEIYAWGLRNPWRFSFDSATGALWIGDVGQGAFEEIDRSDASINPLDRNFGWRVREGAHCTPPATNCATNFIDPVTEYDRNLGQSVTGGYVYRGSAIPNLAGQYVFGDFVQGTIFAIAADAQPTTVPPDVLLDTSLSISTFAEDTGGELYVIDFIGGTIHQIVDAP